MKKYLWLGLALLAMSCSSDEDSPPVEMKDLPQKEVSLTYSRDELDALKYNMFSDLFEITFLNKKPEAKLGHSTIHVQKYRYRENVQSEYRIDYRFFDAVCPYDLYINKYYGTALSSHREPGLQNVNFLECITCGSLFSLSTLKSTKGPAFDKGFTLIEYPKDIDANNVYHVTNPNYKSTIK